MVGIVTYLGTCSGRNMPFTSMLCLRKLQELFGVEVADFLLLRWTESSPLQKRAPLVIRTIGVIDREEDAISAHDLQGQQERWIGEETALVIEKCCKKYSATVRCKWLARGVSIVLLRASIKGSISPICPRIIWRVGRRSKTPARISRSAWIATSECQPHPAVAKEKFTSGAKPEE